MEQQTRRRARETRYASWHGTTEGNMLGVHPQNLLPALLLLLEALQRRFLIFRRHAVEAYCNVLRHTAV